MNMSHMVFEQLWELEFLLDQFSVIGQGIFDAATGIQDIIFSALPLHSQVSKEMHECLIIAFKHKGRLKPMQTKGVFIYCSCL